MLRTTQPGRFQKFLARSLCFSNILAYEFVMYIMINHIEQWRESLKLNPLCNTGCYTYTSLSTNAS